MKKDLDEKLCRDFPKLFGDRDADERVTCMCHGFSCGDGWEPIIRECAAKLEAMNTSNNPSEWVVASQVKEKFGGLRFYIDIPECKSMDSELIHNITNEAENKSEITCEQCGQPGKLRSNRRWILTLCDSCEEKDAK